MGWRGRHTTVGQWLDEWLNLYVEPKMRDGELAASTITSYRGHVRRYLKPELGSIELRKLGPEHVTALYLKMGTPKDLGGYGVSVRTRELTHVTLRMALDRAVVLGRVHSNVLRAGEGVDRPRVRRHRVRALEADDVVGLLGALPQAGWPHDRLFVPAVLALATGMRRGEILALQVSDIYLPPESEPASLGVITVWRTWDKHDDMSRGRSPIERYRIREWPKSGRERYVDIAPEVVAVLRAAILARERRRDGARGDWHTGALRSDGTAIVWGELLVCDEHGNPWWPDSFSSAWRAWCVRAGVRCRFHDLRATSGSLSLEAGTDAEAVSQRLGHHSAAFFLERYARPMHRARERDAAIMGGLVSRIVAHSAEPGRVQRQRRG